jgi:phospholipid/cholesterol/gamma-HCH transport system substrate-binding protein
MINKSSYAITGLFVLVLGAVFIWGVLWISSGGAPRDIDRYIVYMKDSVSGLNADAPVKYRGVDVGKVEDISIDTNNPERIRILLQVRRGTPVSADTVANLDYQVLTGIASVNLAGGSADSPAPVKPDGEPYPVITARPSIFSSLDLTLSDLLNNLMQTSTSINALLNEQNRSNVSRSLENIAGLTEKFSDQSSQLDVIIENLTVTLENTRTASVGFPALIEQFSQSAQAITRMADQLGAIGENLEPASTGVAEFTGSTLPEIAAMVSELRLVSENLRRMSEALASDPSRLLYGSPGPRPGPGESSKPEGKN